MLLKYHHRRSVSVHLDGEAVVRVRLGNAVAHVFVSGVARRATIVVITECGSPAEVPVEVDVFVLPRVLLVDVSCVACKGTGQQHALIVLRVSQVLWRVLVLVIAEVSVLAETEVWEIVSEVDPNMATLGRGRLEGRLNLIMWSMSAVVDT